MSESAMRITFGRTAAVALLIAVEACGGVTREEPAAGGEATGTGGAGAGGGGSVDPTGGSGGMPFDPSTSSTGGAGAGGVTCPIVLDRDNFYMVVSLDGRGGVLDAACPGDEAYGVPVGQLGGGGECEPALFVRACKPPDPPAVGLEVSLASPLTVVGTSSAATGKYADWQLQPLTMSVDAIGEVNEMIEGSFTGVATMADGTPIDVTGEFRVCRIPDVPPCP